MSVRKTCRMPANWKCGRLSYKKLFNGMEGVCEIHIGF